MPQTDTIQPVDSLLPFYQWSGQYEVSQTTEPVTGVPLDSIFVACDSTVGVERTSMFTGHGLAPQHDTMILRTRTEMPAWVFVVIIALCALLSLYYRTRKVKVAELLKSTIDMRVTDRILREAGLKHSGSQVPVALLLTSSVAMLIWAMAMPDSGIGSYLILALGLSVAYLLRNGLLSGLAAVFGQRNTMMAYISGNYLFHQLLTLIVVPMLFIVVYIPIAAKVGTIVVVVATALIILLRYIRGIQLFLTKSKGVSFFLFYYLCIVELIPLLVLLKWFILQ